MNSKPQVLTATRQVQFQGAMSLERFAQEAALSAIPVLLNQAINAGLMIDEVTQESIGKVAMGIGYAASEAYGVNPIPR
jgi:hypothetical protein